MPRLAYVILAADRDHPEWGVACAQLREMCVSAMRGGYDVAADLPDYAAVAFRAMTAGMADAMTTPPTPAPSMTEVMAKTRADFENLALQQHPVPQPERRDIPVGARTVPDRPWMKVPR